MPRIQTRFNPGLLVPGLLALVLAGGALSGPATAGVLIVDANGFGDYTLLQDAIDAASDGDIIVVRPVFGFRDDPTIVGKGLTLIADVGPGVSTVNLDLTIEDVPSGGTVVVRGFHSTIFGDAGVLRVNDCAGAVWIEDCRFSGEGVFGGQSAAEIRNSASVTLLRCTLNGGDGSNGSASFPPFPPTDGGGGLLAVDSAAAIYECTVTGGRGGYNAYYLGANGADGIELQSSSACLSGSTVAGGDEGSPDVEGGDGVQLDEASKVDWFDSSSSAGAGGVAMNAPTGTIQPLEGTARTLIVPAPKREGQGGLLTVQGVPGDVIWYFVGVHGGSLPLPGMKGWFLIDPNLMAGPFALGVISDADGSLQMLFVAPTLKPPALEGQDFLLQPLFVNDDGITLGAASCFVLLKTGF